MENVRHLTPRDTDAGDGGLERVPPQDLDAEQSVLGAMLLAAQAITDTATAMDPADHYRPAHETIHRTILDLYAKGEPADPITVADALTKRGEIARVGGSSYLFQLVNAVPTAANAEYYADIVHSKARLRRLIETVTRIAARGYAGDGDVDEILDQARADFEAATTTTARGPGHLAESLLNWDDFFNTDFGSVQLLVGRLMGPGEQIAIVGDGKAGKSLFTLEWLWRMAAGRAFLGDRPADPVPVLYVDGENGRDKIQERLFSYGAGPGRMGLLTYASFPPIRPLDTPGGGADLMAMVRATGARVVCLDTVSRFISGEENSADTWLSLYRCTLLPLKREGIASIRLDHFGKDKDRGARGNSAKTQDVDHVWELSAQGGGMLSLRRTHTRTGVGPGSFAMRREARQDGDNWIPGATRHVLYEPDGFGMDDPSGMAAVPGTVEYIVAHLDKHTVPEEWGSPRVIKACAELGIQARKSKIEEAVRIRKNRTPGDLPPHLPPSTFNQPPPNPGDPPPLSAGQTSPGEVGGRSGGGSPQGTSPRPPSKEGGGAEDRGTPTPLCLLCRTPLDPTRHAAGYDTHHPCP
ncbi:DnaB-like helicase N-terminal domain-containing protein [Actinacidiphila sp. ITFR-21]|uniref:DnaB-like helicase N-terminal domain-containing protein n=1 Tax=Actinacidiphila sp. ITFR-21 TaxID=3075199 RepID=UPI00288AF9EA|nr:DnaB-like helicase N-terminal domain-containing protein [Streptomyces sp. ITFR-21]WNI15557.1 DnaB-like helicase N-terminal domain-containing protein [Streptomyces sp. ITFR-21]